MDSSIFFLVAYFRHLLPVYGAAADEFLVYLFVIPVMAGDSMCSEPFLPSVCSIFFLSTAAVM
jgi:hypothetical protein